MIEIDPNALYPDTAWWRSGCGNAVDDTLDRCPWCKDAKPREDDPLLMYRDRFNYRGFAFCADWRKQAASIAQVQKYIKAKFDERGELEIIKNPEWELEVFWDKKTKPHE